MPHNTHCAASAALDLALLAITYARSDDTDHERVPDFGAPPFPAATSGEPMESSSVFPKRHVSSEILGMTVSARGRSGMNTSASRLSTRSQPSRAFDAPRIGATAPAPVLPHPLGRSRAPSDSHGSGWRDMPRPALPELAERPQPRLPRPRAAPAAGASMALGETAPAAGASGGINRCGRVGQSLRRGERAACSRISLGDIVRWVEGGPCHL
jgi:hypothetical protein